MSQKANPNKVRFGISNLYIAPIKSVNSGETPQWEVPIKCPGAVSLTQDAETEETVFWADNTRYWSTYTDNGYTGELNIAQIPEEVLVNVYGWKIDELGGLVEIANSIKKEFAILGQFEGDKRSGRWVIYYNTGGKPSTEDNTTEEAQEPQTQTLPYTATPLDLGNGVKVTKYTLWDDPDDADRHAAYQNWFKAVTVPKLAELEQTPAAAPASLSYGVEV